MEEAAEQVLSAAGGEAGALGGRRENPKKKVRHSDLRGAGAAVQGGAEPQSRAAHGVRSRGRNGRKHSPCSNIHTD